MSAVSQLAVSTVASVPGFVLRPEGDERYELEVLAELGLGWFGGLASALARRGLSIESAHATRTPDDAWTGRLRIHRDSEDAADPALLDFFELCREYGERATDIPKLETFRLQRTEKGSLELRFFGKDQVGLLAWLLARVEFLGLFPERLSVTTQGERVDDTLWLRGVAGNSASTPAEHALVELLKGLTAG